MQRQLCFLNLVCFFPWLAGRFHNFELTQNREKTRNGLREILRFRAIPSFLLFVFHLSWVKTYPHADAKQRKTKKWPNPVSGIFSETQI